MSCRGCLQEILEKNEREKATYDEAQDLANRTGEWVAIYTTESGISYCLASEAAGKYIRAHIPPVSNHTASS